MMGLLFPVLSSVRRHPRLAALAAPIASTAALERGDACGFPGIAKDAPHHLDGFTQAHFLDSECMSAALEHKGANCHY